MGTKRCKIDSSGIEQLIFFQKIEPKTFFLEIGQYGHQKMQNFTLIPNEKARKKTVPSKRVISPSVR